MSYESERISKSVSPLQVAQRYGIVVDRRGYALCPFHVEDTASFMVDSEVGGHFHCYGCSAHGDSISLVMKLLNIPFKEALKELDATFRLGILGEDSKPIVSTSYERKSFNQRHKKRVKTSDYYEMCNKHGDYHMALKQRPASWEEATDEFIEALQNMDQLAYKIDCIEEGMK